MLPLSLPLQARLERSTAELAEESPIICLFVNDNCDAKVPAAFNTSHHLSRLSSR